jgi:Uma2 family endonuclease
MESRKLAREVGYLKWRPIHQRTHGEKPFGSEHMATVSSDHFDRSPLVPTPRLLTAADLAALPDELPSGPVRYELDNGSLIMMAPAGESHADTQKFIVTELTVQGERRGCGKAYGEIGVILWKNPFRVVEPDAAFVKKTSLPLQISPEGYLETIPELIVEVRSKNDTKAYIARKVGDYLDAGAQLVWVIDPDDATAIEHYAGAAAKSLSITDVLECEDIIPGFRLPLRELFGG